VVVSDLFARDHTVQNTLISLRTRMREIAHERERLDAFVRVIDAGVPSSAYRETAPPNPEELRGRLIRTARELSLLRDQEAELMTEQHSVKRALEREGLAKRSLPVIGSISIAAPCPASWAEMSGDEHVRMCKTCKKNVFNLSEMTTEDASRLLQDSEGKICVRFYERSDGTVMTADCPEGIKRRERRNALRGAMLAVAAAFGVWAVKEVLAPSPCSVVRSGHGDSKTPPAMGFGGAYVPATNVR
jgi:hypothetical protein